MGRHADDTSARRWSREPLVHFLLIGALLFLLSARWGGGAGSGRIVVTPGQIDSMATGFARTWLRPPTEQELKGLVDEYVREEIAVREAMAAGLDRDDTIIRRRLRQKLEFLAEDAAEATPPTEAELRDWLARHPEQFGIEPQVAFHHVYLSPDRRGPGIEDEARRLLATLSAGGPPGTSDATGDSLMLPAEFPRSSRSEVARQFGEGFAAAVVALEPGQWAGPIPSGYGLHLVYLRERADGATPSLDEVRPIVEREFLAARRAATLDAMYERLLEQYTVTVEQRPATPPAADADTTPAPGGAK